jgi:hypothetical protein
MKTTILWLAIAGLLPSCVFAEPTLKEVVNEYRANYAQSKNDRKPVVGERIAELFLRYPASHIVISSFSGGGNKLHTDIYIKEEEIYVMKSSLPPFFWTLST